jgi:RHS repeat-associated protein
MSYDGSLLTTTTTTGPQSVSDGPTTVWSGTLAGSVTQGYDSVFNVASMSVAGGFAASYGRDNDDLVTSIAPLSPSTGPTMTLVRSPLDGHLTSTTLGVVSTAIDLDVDQATPGTGDLLGMSASVNSTVIYGSSYVRDDLGRITELSETIEGMSTTRKYEYDDAGRLTIVKDENNTVLSVYGYDRNGARTLAFTSVGSSAGTVELGTNLGCGALLDAPVDDQDRLCLYGDHQYAYDDNGRLSSKTDPGLSTQTLYRYDGLGRLRTVEELGGTRIDYVLDAMGRRIGKVVDGALEKGWVYGPGSLSPVAQLDSSGALEMTFVYATHVNVPDLIVTASGTVYRVVTDHLGSVRLVIDVASGTVVQRVDYDEFGNVDEDTDYTAPGFSQPFGFAGGLYDADTGLVRFGARDYDAVTGRWTAKDPLRFVSGTNLYLYSRGDPVNRIDPNGLVDIFFQVEGEFAVPFLGGFDAAIGVVFDTDNFSESGIFSSFGAAAGLTIGISAGGGIVDELEGHAGNIDINAGLASGSLIIAVDEEGISLNGFAVGYGPGAGAAFSGTNADTLPFEQICE